jgi:hypothetical protein
MKIYVHLNTTEFDEGQLMYESTDPEQIMASMQVVFRDTEDAIVESLTQQFTLVVNNNVEVENPCFTAELEQKSIKARDVYDIVFMSQLDDKEDEIVPLFIDKALETKFKDSAHEGCPVNF